MKPAFLSLINTHQFTTMDHEDPYTHLSIFYELVETMSFQFVYLCLFPFSLAGKAKEGLKSHSNERLTSWKDVEESRNFYKDFPPYPPTSKLCFDISMFKQ